MLIKYNWIVANYHKGFLPNKKLVIFGMWLPGLPKDSQDSDYQAFFAAWYDIVIPEYIWSFRSEWEFTPDNCYKTLLDTKQHFKDWIVFDLFAKTGITVKYNEIEFLGSSFGGYLVSRLPLYDETIKRIGLLFPALQLADMWKIGFVEESNDDFDYIMLTAGLGHLYRGYPSQEREDFNNDKHGFSYDQMVEKLSSIPVFVAHGELDSCIHYSRSDKFISKLSHSDNLYIKLPKWDHGSSTRVPATPEYCKWLNNIT